MRKQYSWILLLSNGITYNCPTKGPILLELLYLHTTSLSFIFFLDIIENLASSSNNKTAISLFLVRCLKLSMEKRLLTKLTIPDAW